MDNKDLCYSSVARLGALIRGKEVSPVELAQAYLDRIEEVEPALNSFITVLADGPMEAARRAEQEVLNGTDRGPLHGIPMAIKDVYDTVGIPTTFGCRAFETYVAQEDSTTVERLKEAGTVLLGKLNLHTLEYGATGENSHYGNMHNPWGTDRVTGGSSGGSASGVAAGECSVAMGSDTGGSIRAPAALCGIVGLKPTFGRISRHGIMGMSPTMDHHGPMTRTVEDCATLLQVVAGYDPRDARSSKEPVPDYVASLSKEVTGLRVGVVREFADVPTDPEVRQAVDAALKVLEQLGTTVVEVSWPMHAYSYAISSAIQAVDTSTELRELVAEQGQHIEPSIRARIRAGLFIPSDRYLRAQKARAIFNRECNDLLQQVDVLVGPTVPVPAPRMDQEEISVEGVTMPTVLTIIQYTRAGNLNGLPAVSVPCGFTASGLPVGLQLTGRAFDEETVLRVAHAYEQATPWHTKRPPL